MLEDANPSCARSITRRLVRERQECSHCSRACHVGQSAPSFSPPRVELDCCIHVSVDRRPLHDIARTARPRPWGGRFGANWKTVTRD